MLNIELKLRSLCWKEQSAFLRIHKHNEMLNLGYGKSFDHYIYFVD